MADCDNERELETQYENEKYPDGEYPDEDEDEDVLEEEGEEE